MQALAALRGATFADTRKWTSTDSLRRGLRWDRNTTSRVLAFHESKGLVAIDPEQYIFGQKVYLTAAGIEEVEWSILHPTEDRSDRAAWLVNLLPLVDALLKLPTTVVDDMLRNLRSTDRLSRESVEREMQVVGGDDARRAVLALLRDPAVESIGTWLAVLIALLAFVQSCQQNDADVTPHRQVIVLQQAFEQARDSEVPHEGAFADDKVLPGAPGLPRRNASPDEPESNE